jgi:hypothetical protein
MSVSGEYTRLALIEQHLAAVTIVLDLVNPLLALRWVIDKCSELRLNKAELVI